MPVYAYRLAPTSGFRNPPSASTLWGHLAWAIRELEGEDALIDWIEEHKQALSQGKNPPVRLSSAFPDGFLPRPLLKPRLITSTKLRKDIKSVRWVSVELFKAMLEFGEKALADKVEQGDRTGNVQSDSWFIKVPRTRVAMNRLTGAAAAGFLYEDISYWPTGGLVIYAQLGNGFSPDQLEKLLGYVGLGGYGGGSSIGNGSFSVTGYDEVDMPTAESGDCQVILGPALLPQNGRGRWRSELYWGRLGNVFAHTNTPFKQPYLRATEGSVICKPELTLLETTPPTMAVPNVTIWDNLAPLTVAAPRRVCDE